MTLDFTKEDDEFHGRDPTEEARKKEKGKEILNSIIIDLRNLAENEQKAMSHYVYEALWNIIQGLEHDLKEIKNK